MLERRFATDECHATLDALAALVLAARDVDGAGAFRVAHDIECSVHGFHEALDTLPTRGADEFRVAHDIECSDHDFHEALDTLPTREVGAAGAVALVHEFEALPFEVHAALVFDLPMDRL